MSSKKESISLRLKMDDLKETINTLEEMEENRFLLFTAFGSISILLSIMGMIFVFSISSMETNDIPVLYYITSFFLILGSGMLWNGFRETDLNLQLDKMRKKLSEIEQMVFMSEIGNLQRKI